MSSSVVSRLHGLFSKRPKQISSVAALFPPTPNQPTPTSPIPPPPKIQSLVSNFIQNSKYPDFRLNHDHYKAIVHRLAAEKHFSAIETILEWQKQYEDMAEEGFGIRLICLYGKAGMFDHACKVFVEMPMYNCPRTVNSFNALLTACVNSRRFDKVGGSFLELGEKLGVKLDVFSYNVVLKGLCESNDLDSAMKVIEKMEESLVRPDIVSYNTLMVGYYRENKVGEAEKLWRRMEEKGVNANVLTYNAKLRGLVLNDQVQEALELLEKMVNEGLNPDNYSYNAVIKGCVRNGDLEEAKMLHGKMVGDGRLPDCITYQMLIPCACEQGDIDFALELCKQAVKLKVHVYRYSMQRVVDELIKRSKIEEANELVALASSSYKHRYPLTLPTTALSN